MLPLTILLIITISISQVHTQCPLQATIPNLEAGEIQFSVAVNQEGQQNQVYNHPFKQSLRTLPTVAFAVQRIALKSMNVQSWSVKSQNVTQLGISVAFAHFPSRWTSLKIGFWASANDQITVGFSDIGFNDREKGKGIKKVEYISVAQREIKNLRSSISRSFITGFTSHADKQISIKILDSNLGLKNNQSILSLLIEIQNMNITVLNIHYVIFSPREATFASYGSGVNEQNFSGSKMIDVNKFIPENTMHYQMYGFTSLNITVQDSLFNLNVDMKSGHYLRIDSFEPVPAFALFYIILGVSPKNMCSQCESSSRLVAEKFCVASCPQGSYEMIYGQTRGCRICPLDQKMIPNKEKTSCICVQGYEITQNGVCKETISKINPQTSFTPTLPFSPSTTSASTPTLNPSAPSYTPKIPKQLESQDKSSNIENLREKISKYTVETCVIPNSYWTGYRCACKVGYSLQSGACTQINLRPNNNEIFKPSEFLNKLSALYRQQPVPKCSKYHEVYDPVYKMCVCKQNFIKNEHGLCSEKKKDNQCPINFVWDLPTQKCRCPIELGFKFWPITNTCSRESPNTCHDPHSYSNGLGECICKKGFYRKDETCIPGSPCPPYSQRLNPHSEICTCIPGYRKFGNYCSKCDLGQVWLAEENQCIFTCGVNQEVFNKKCRCKSGYGIYDGLCNICPPGFIIKDQYCVACPVNSHFSQDLQQCICSNGYSKNPSQVCVSKCNKFEYFNEDKQECRCLEGLGRVNGECKICRDGVVLKENQECSNDCEKNEVKVNGICKCKAGLARDFAHECVSCPNPENCFIIDGYWATCPNKLWFFNGKCQCQEGKKWNPLKRQCEKTCRPDQIEDPQGYCYSCPYNELISPDRKSCVCRTGLIRPHPTGFCQLSCQPGEHMSRGRCAKCVLNTIFDEEARLCICPADFFTNEYGVCQEFIPSCSDKHFLDHISKKCTPCASGCQKCLSLTRCLTCENQFFEPSHGQCRPKCGDGVKFSPYEECDDGNFKDNDGCSSTCKREAGFTCDAQNLKKTICLPRGPYCGDGLVNTKSEQCDDGNSRKGDGCDECKLQLGWKCENNSCQKEVLNNKGMILTAPAIVNFNNVFVILQVHKAYTFSTTDEMKEFMKYSFQVEGSGVSVEPNSAFCMQNAHDKRIFECLMIYASGVPIVKYEIDFNYDFKGDQGFISVEIDPFKSKFQTRSLK